MDEEVSTKAETLREALNRFDPERPLQTDAELEQFFVAREGSPLEQFQLLLETSSRPQKFLFTGHRGSGKTTELARFRRQLNDGFRVIGFSVMKELDLFELEYVDVLLGIGLKLAQVATEEDVDVKDEVLDHVLRFTKDITEEVQIEERDGADLGASLNAYVATLSAKLRAEDVTRRTVRESVDQKIRDLLESIELLTKEIESATGQKLVAVIDDLDKVDLGTAKRMFYKNATSLSEPPLSIIYTYPMPLRHENSFQQIRNSFSNSKSLPNIKTQRRDGTAFEPGLQVTKQVITKRIDAGLIEDEALDEMATLSSGIPRQLIVLARQACLDAIMNDKAVIDADAVQSAANQQRKEYQILLSRAQRDLLREVHASKEINNDEAHRELLHNLSVLRYENDDVWYDVHPIVVSLIDTDDDADACSP